MISIGCVQIENNVFSAPMAGVTDLPFRLVCKRFGAGLVFSEMVSSRALFYGDKKTAELLKTDEREKPLAVQIFGNSPEIMAEAVHAALSTGASILDINMGCPAPKITNSGDGSALLKNPALAGKIVRAVSDASPVPVTCKIRSGFDEVCDAAEFAKMLEASGAAAITVHPRTRAMYYGGHADWSIIKKVKDAVSVPVIGNGDIKCALDARAMLERTGCDAIMVGRAARGNPFIFREILSLLEKGEPYPPPTVTERMAVLKEQLVALVRLKGEYVGVREARKHVAWYIKGMRGSAPMRERVCKTESFAALIDELDEYTEFLKANDNK